jgi:molybdopterin/thiamine biosynthesis adenylyltransferase
VSLTPAGSARPASATRDRVFSYDEMVGRNLGFVTLPEQERLRAGSVFVCGIGGMGGAAVQSLARAGVGSLALADTDRFEVSNLNRQVFATLDTVGERKVDATARGLAALNPELRLTTFDAGWVDRLDEILPRFPVVVNGMDDARAGIALYRKAREHGATVIDAYTSPLPSVTVVRPADPRPELRLGFPTVGTDWRALTAEQLDACKTAEAVYVLVHSSSARHVDLNVAAQMLAGRRARPSFAPMVIATGTLMAFEALKLLLGRPSGVDYRGVFLDPWAMRVERPRPAPVAWVMGKVARRMLRRLTVASG